MLFSIVMDAACLAPEYLGQPEAGFGAEKLLDAVITNGVILCADRNEYLREMVVTSSSLPTRSGQRVQLLAAEIAKNPRRFIAEPGPVGRIQGRGVTDVPLLGRLAVELVADIVICRDQEQVGKLVGLAQQGIETCTLSDYTSSQTEAKRRTWTGATRVDNLGTVESEALTGRMVRYATEVIVVDRFFASAAKDGRITKRLRKFAQSLVYIADAWVGASPYAHTGGPTIHLISVAGTSGAASGYVDAGVAERTIRDAVQQADRRGNIGTLQIALKKDRVPPIANDRFISCTGRCFGIQHGIDDLANLRFAHERRRPTSFIPDSQGVPGCAFGDSRARKRCVKRRGGVRD